eukprot:6472956-Alexandrium_andersonii.AAC.1
MTEGTGAKAQLSAGFLKPPGQRVMTHRDLSTLDVAGPPRDGAEAGLMHGGNEDARATESRLH